MQCQEPQLTEALLQATKPMSSGMQPATVSTTAASELNRAAMRGPVVASSTARSEAQAAASSRPDSSARRAPSAWRPPAGVKVQSVGVALSK